LSVGSAAGQLLSQVGLVLLLLCSLRILIARVVRYSIRDGIRLTTIAADIYKPVAMIGFSWGGGVLWEMLETWKGNALLLAPAVSAMSYISRSTPTTHRFKTKRVSIVAGDDDPFCPPSQKRIFKDSGCAYYAVDDDHVLLKHGTRLLTAKIVNQFLSLSEEASRSSS
jgi:predicted esterase